MPIGSAKSCVDIYATGSVRHAWDVQNPADYRQHVRGFVAGRMYTGAARQCGDMETT
jgi:hypothetical protein